LVTFQMVLVRSRFVEGDNCRAGFQVGAWGTRLQIRRWYILSKIKLKPHKSGFNAQFLLCSN
jgi:hypothetical protein